MKCYSESQVTLARNNTGVQICAKIGNFDLWPLLTLCANEIPKNFCWKMKLAMEVFNFKLVRTWDLDGAARYDALKFARGRFSSKSWICWFCAPSRSQPFFLVFVIYHLVLQKNAKCRLGWWWRTMLCTSKVYHLQVRLREAEISRIFLSWTRALCTLIFYMWVVGANMYQNYFLETILFFFVSQIRT